MKVAVVERFQNQYGIVSEIPVLDTSNLEYSLCVRSHIGKRGPSLQEVSPIVCSLKGGTQSESRLKVKELKDMSK